MFKHKKAVAFIMCILICSSAAAPTSAFIFADDDTTASQSIEEDTTEESPATDSITSGDYTYSLNDDSTACIESYTGSETDISIPETIDGINVTSIGESAFVSSAVTSVHIPAGITNISLNNPFIECTSLKEFTVDSANSEYSAVDGVLYAENGTMIVCYPSAKEGTSFTIPEGVTDIGIASIYQTQLTEIKLPTTLLYLNRHGLSYNERLTSIDFSNTGLTIIDDMAMSFCTSLSSVTFSDTLTEIGGAAFAGCTALKNIEFPASLTDIYQNAFAATGLSKVTIPATVTTIGYCAFGYDENLQPLSSFVIYGEAGSAAETYCTDSDEDYEYTNSFTFKTLDEKEDDVDSLESLESIEFGDYTYAEVDGEAYITACVSGESTIEVPSEINGLPVTNIYGGAFFQNGASKIVLPDTIKTIEPLAFYMCSSLIDITIPDSVITIKAQAFADCTSLEKITLPGSCSEFGEDVFLGCTELKEITVSSADGGILSADDGILFSSDKTIIYAYPASKEGSSYKAPSNVTEIAVSAFSGNTQLESIKLPSVVTINNYAFENCSKLKSVELSKELTTIGDCAFYNCSSLKGIRLYDKIESIGKVAIGFIYDDSSSADVVADGFKIYASKDSGGARYASTNSIECISNTVSIFGQNVQYALIYIIIGILAVIVLVIAGIIIGKFVKKNRQKKETAQIKADAQKKMAERKKTEAEAENCSSETTSDSNRKESENEIK